MIVAVLIVKNESHVLERCLRSVLPHVGGVFISDTGSTDADKDIVASIVDRLEREFDKKIVVKNRFWAGFAISRNDALEEATKAFQLNAMVDWLFMIDADDYVTEWEAPPFDTMHAGFTVTMRSEGGTTYPRTQLFRPGLWRYRGVVHEFAECTAPAHTVGTLQTTVISTREGSRNWAQDKYLKDAELIIEGMRVEGDGDLLPRYMFYLAQSYRDAGRYDYAYDAYAARASLNEGYQEERYVSLLNFINIYPQINPEIDNHGWKELIAAMATAQEICPHRREAVTALMNVARQYKEWRLIWSLYRDYEPCPIPTGLFIDPLAYDFTLEDEAGIACYYLGYYADSVKHGVRALLLTKDLPASAYRVVENLQHASSRL